MALQKSARLKKRRDFLRVQKFGTRAFGRYVVAIAVIAKNNESKFGITVGKKIGKAVLRNLVKRRIRHILEQTPSLFQNKEIVIIARPKISDATFHQIKEDITKTCSRL